MRKGQGELTYKQLLDENKRLRKENDKLRNELHSRTVAYNKLHWAAYLDGARAQKKEDAG